MEEERRGARSETLCPCPYFQSLLASPQALMTFFALFLTLSLINGSWAHTPGQLPTVPCPCSIRVPVASATVPGQGCCPAPGTSLPNPTVHLAWLVSWQTPACWEMGVTVSPVPEWHLCGWARWLGQVTKALLLPEAAFGGAVAGGQGAGARGKTFPEPLQGGKGEGGGPAPLRCSSNTKDARWGN